MTESDDPDKTPLPPTVAWDPAEVEAAHADTDPDDALIGSLIRDKWRVLSRIGAGSFGTVYKVRDEAGGWIEALKILRVDRLRGAEGDATRARFLREARIMKRLGSKSRHIVRLSTYEEDAEAGLIYFLMEHVEGKNLAEVLEDEGPLAIDRVIQVALQACDALIAAHESDPPVVHRDLKLQNLMMTQDDDGSARVMVLDFGIAKIADADVDSRLTTTGAIGTPGYAAPEQIRAEEVDGRTDLFALGVILYALLTGRDPWLGKMAHEPTDQVYQLMAATDRCDVLPLRDHRPDVPDEVSSMVTRLLQREPDDRYASARIFRDKLREFANISTREFPEFGTEDKLPPVPTAASGDTMPERRLAAVWFADLVGYSSLSATDEGAALALLDVFHATARKIIDAGGGRLVQFIGDAAFAEFTSTERAVRTAVQFHDEFALATEKVKPKPLLRTGIHVGDVLMAANGDLFGDGVNVAARIQNAAEPGQILVSQDVWRQLKQRRDFHFASVGERELKGLGSPVWLFAVVPPEEATTTSIDTGSLMTQSPMLPAQDQQGRRVHVAGAAVTHLAASGVMIWASTVLRDRFGFPDWITLGAGVLLALGLVIVLVTSWVQSRPTWQRPVTPLGAWSLAPGDLIRSLRQGQLPGLTWARTVAGGFVAFTGLLLVASVVGPTAEVGNNNAQSRIEPAVSSASPQVAVLPFAVSGMDAFLSEGVPDLMGYALAGAGVAAADPLVLRRQIDEEGGEGTRAAQALGSRFVINGSIQGPATAPQLSATLVDVRTGEELSSASVSDPARDLGALVADLTNQLLSGSPLADTEGSVNPVVFTTSPEALLAFLEGERLVRDGEWREAIAAFGRSKEADPDFALALVRLSFTRALASSPQPYTGDPDAQRALELGEQLPLSERRLVSGLLQLANGSNDAIGIFDELAGIRPGDPDVLYLLGDAVYHVEGPTSSDATDAFERAIMLAGQYDPASAHLIAAAVAQGSVGRAQTLLDELKRRSPESVFLPPLEETLRMASGTNRSEPIQPDATPQPAATRPVQEASSPTRPQPSAVDDGTERARTAYAELARSVGAARGDAVGSGIPQQLQQRLLDLDAMRTRADASAASNDFDEASALQEQARAGYDALSTNASDLRQYESTRSALASLRPAAGTVPSRSEAERLENEATRAANAGDYTEAVQVINRARTAWERAGVETTEAARVSTPAAPSPREIAVDVLDRLDDAMESEDMARVRSVWTSISAEEAQGLEGLFDAVDEISVRYDVVSTREQSGSIVAVVGTTYRFTMSGSEQAPEIEQEFTLENRGGTWVVTASVTTSR